MLCMSGGKHLGSLEQGLVLASEKTREAMSLKQSSSKMAWTLSQKDMIILFGLRRQPRRDRMQNADTGLDGGWPCSVRTSLETAENGQRLAMLSADWLGIERGSLPCVRLNPHHTRTHTHTHTQTRTLLSQLPDSATRQSRGVVLEDDVLAAFDVRFKPQPEPQAPTSPADVPVAHLRRGGGGGGGGGGEGAGASEAMASAMLSRLQQLPWRRVDVCFSGSPLALLAHNHIQVTRRWLNFEGRDVAAHLADTLVALEEAAEQLAAHDAPIAIGQGTAGEGTAARLRAGRPTSAVASAGAAAARRSSLDAGLMKDAAAGVPVAAGVGSGSLGAWLAQRALQPHNRTTSLLSDGGGDGSGGNSDADGGVEHCREESGDSDEPQFAADPHRP